MDSDKKKPLSGQPADVESAKSYLSSSDSQTIKRLKDDIQKESNELIKKICESENSTELEYLMLRLFDLFGLGVDDIGKQTYRLTSTERLPVNIPGNRSGTVVITFDRLLAVSRDDQVLLSWDHPIVTGCIEQLLASVIVHI